MNVLADLREVANGVDQALTRVTRMRARKTDPLHARYVSDVREEIDEVAARIVRCRVMIDDLSKELNLLPPRGDGLSNVSEDGGPRDHSLVASPGRHHAEGTVIVAALDDGDVRLDGVLAMRDAKRERHVI